MNLIPRTHPCYLLEAAELVFSHVNALPARELSGSGEFCIPPEQAEAIRGELCRELDPRDRLLQYYFQGFPLEDGRSRLSNLATTLLYSCMLELPSPAEDYRRSLLEFWQKLSPPYCISAADPMALSITGGSGEEFTTLSEEINKVPVSPAYQIRLVEAFCSYEQSLQRLLQLLEPLSRRLEPLLEPWVQRAQSLLRRWEQYFSQPQQVEDFFRSKVEGFECRELEFCLRYFPGEGGYYRVYDEPGREGRACLLLGLGMAPDTSGGSAPREPMLDDQQATALRLISNPDRLAMLRVMMQRSLSGHEVAEALGLNSGTVFRDLNNLATAQLITRDFRGRKSIYRTNIEALRQLLRRIEQVVDPAAGRE